MESRSLHVWLIWLLLLTASVCALAREALASDVPAVGTVTLVDLGAKACVPCKMMAPILEELKQEYRGKAAVVFIDVWQNKDEAERFGVRSIPTQIFYDRKGNEVFRHVGFMDKASITERLDTLIKEQDAQALGLGATDPTLLDALFLKVNAWMTKGVALAALGCFLWGVISVLFSPCHLASIPLIIGYVAGQNKVIEGWQAALCAAVFTTGLFITITLVGLVCSLLGRMLGDVGPWWTVPVGAVLVWVGLDMLGVAKCSLPGGSGLSKLKMRGMRGAFVLGLSYGVLSGACTFGFIAPILAIITVQQQVATGVILVTLFAIGHCLPIVLAGSSAATVRRLLEHSAYAQGGLVFRKLAGALVVTLGLYFAASPFLG